jgi:hypothetical protein
MTAQILLFPIPNKRAQALREAYDEAARADYETEMLRIFCERQQESR